MTDTLQKTIAIYIAGPMRGHFDFNRGEFNKAEKSLLKTGVFSPVNPAAMDKESGMSDSELLTKEGLRKAIRRDIDVLLDCQAIYMLSGWEKSEGARIEHALATMLDMTIIYQ